MTLATKMIECEACDGHGWRIGLGRRITCGTCYGAGEYETWDDEPTLDDQATPSQETAS